MRSWVVAVVAAGVLGANDGSMTMGIGGLVPLQSTAVRMEREELEISTREIRVRYWFRNVTGKMERVRVGFPLPQMNGGDLANRPVHIPVRGENFVGFRVWVDGVERDAALEVRAFDQDDKEITAKLEKLRMKGALLSDDFQLSLARVTKKEQEQMEQRGWLDCFEMEQRVCLPFWKESHIYHWEQEFPPGKVVRVEHRYRPVVGGIYPIEKLPDDAHADAERCLSEKTILGMAPLPPGFRIMQKEVAYVLKNARSWKGPIGEFHLVLEGDQEDTVLATCFQGLRKTGPGRWEMRVKEFVPGEDLRVLLLTKCRR